MGTAHAKQRCPSARFFFGDSRSPGTSDAMFSMSKIVCADARGKACKICAIGTPQCGGKKERLCFIKGKSNVFLPKPRIFQKENRTIILHFQNAHKKHVDFFSKRHLFRNESRSFWVKEVLAASHAHTAIVPSRVGTRPYVHPPAHRALSEFEFLAFTLHHPI